MARCKGCIHDNVCNRDIGHGYGVCPHYISAADVVPRAEVAKEIFEEIYEDCFDQFGYIDYDALDELKKKYTGENN